MNKTSAIKHAIAAAIAGSLATLANPASASGFQLFEQNAVNMGDFGAGGAAIANDASTAYYNPAGMVRITHQQIVLSGDLIMSHGIFKGQNTWSSTNIPGYSFTQSGKAQGGTTNFVPAFHYSLPLNEQWFFGFSVGAPFGLATDYPNSSVLRYSATYSKLTTIDLSPSIAFKIDPKLSVGAGIDIERVDAELDGVAGLPGIGLPTTANADSLSKNEGDDWGYGWHAGVLYQFTPGTRVGLAYRSKVNFELQGSSRLSGPLAGLGISPGGTIRSNNLEAHLTLPPTTTLSGYHEFNNQWAISSSINYTQWTVFNKALGLQNVAAVTIDPTTGLLVPTQIDVSLPQHFRNTWRFSLGGQYHPFEQWTFRAGAGYDETPTSDTYRSIRLPDANRYALAIGAHYQAIKNLGFDLGWTHLFFQKTRVKAPVITGTQTSVSAGRYNENRADLVGAQLTWDIN